MKTLLFVCILSYPCRAQVAGYPLLTSGNHVGVYSTHFKDAFSFTANPASLARSSGMRAGVHGEQRYGLQELRVYTLAVELGMGSSGLGLSANHLGYEGYQNTQAGLSYGKSLGAVDLGVYFGYRGRQVEAYGSEGQWLAGIGTCWHLSDKVHAGFYLLNPWEQTSMGAAEYSAGLGYEVSTQVTTSVQVVKRTSEPVDVQAALQYIFDNRLFMRLGMATAPGNIYGGVGWKWEQWRVDVRAAYHSELGLTPGIALFFGPKENP